VSPPGGAAGADQFGEDDAERLGDGNVVIAEADMHGAPSRLAREQRHHGPQPLSQYEREVPKPPIDDELGH
jgi:hypothetical protein